MRSMAGASCWRHEASLPLLYVARPVAGLVVQPIIGETSDRTLSPRGRRRLCLLAGALSLVRILVVASRGAAHWATRR